MQRASGRQLAISKATTHLVRFPNWLLVASGLGNLTTTHLASHVEPLPQPPKEPPRWCCSSASLTTGSASSSYYYPCLCFLQVSARLQCTVRWNISLPFSSAFTFIAVVPISQSLRPVTQLSVTAATMWRPAPTCKRSFKNCQCKNAWWGWQTCHTGSLRPSNTVSSRKVQPSKTRTCKP